jgi:hypothetical protein
MTTYSAPSNTGSPVLGLPSVLRYQLSDSPWIRSTSGMAYDSDRPHELFSDAVTPVISGDRPDSESTGESA